MGLYLCIFDGDDELDGVEVGSYADFGVFRTAVQVHVEAGVAGSRCPTLMLHSDCDGQWDPLEVKLLQIELAMIAARFVELPSEPIANGWKLEVVKMYGLRPTNLYDCFFDVDGEPILKRLMSLAELSVAKNLPILFQ